MFRILTCLWNQLEADWLSCYWVNNCWILDLPSSACFRSCHPHSSMSAQKGSLSDTESIACSNITGQDEIHYDPDPRCIPLDRTCTVLNTPTAPQSGQSYAKIPKVDQAAGYCSRLPANPYRAGSLAPGVSAQH